MQDHVRRLIGALTDMRKALMKDNVQCWAFFQHRRSPVGKPVRDFLNATPLLPEQKQDPLRGLRPMDGIEAVHSILLPHDNVRTFIDGSLWLMEWHRVRRVLEQARDVLRNVDSEAARSAIAAIEKELGRLK